MRISVSIIILITLSFNILGCEKSNDKLTKQNSATNTVTKEVVSSTITNISDDKAPGFSLKSVDGKVINLSDYKDKVVIIDFWATWCPPCRKGIPDLISIQNDFKDEIVIIGISLDGEKTINDVPAFVKNFGINYPILYGDEKVVTAYGGIDGIPTAFVVDKKGNVVDKHVGLVDKKVYINKIKELLR
jgi:cytochrome c biogenesis protein CcmG, thiol:disulfide interchange protein DsbE